MTQKYDRFKAAPWFKEGVRPPVLIGGAGGIGSWLTVLLNRAGFETHVYDFDMLEAINMAGQLFMHSSIGKPKVYALEDLVTILCQDTVITYNEKVTENTMTNEIVFSAFDNMQARKDVFLTWAGSFINNPKAIFIDGRLTAEQLTIFCIKGDDAIGINEYLDLHLFDDSEVEALPCTFAQTSHGAAMIASQMVTFFTNWYAGVLGMDTSRYVPFYWEYMLPIGFMSSRDATTERSNISPILDESYTTIETLLTQHPHYVIPSEPTQSNTGIDFEIPEGDVDDLALREIKRVDLTQEEIANIDEFLDGRGLINLVDSNSPSDSLDFEEEANPGSTDESATPTLPYNDDNLPF